MRALRETLARGLTAAACTTSLIGLAVGASASEYFSWIDRSGTIVLTDDLSNLPPARQRSAVTVHSFPERPPTPATLPDVPHDPDQMKRGESRNASPQEDSRPAPELRRPDPTNLDLPTVMLDSPDEAVKWQYAWVPLTMPIYQSGNSIKGFWAHHNAGSPFAAFHEFLQRNAGQPIGNRMIGGRMTGGNQRQAEVPSDIRFMQGLLVLTERMTPPAQPIPAPRSLQASGSRNGHSGAGR